MQPAASFDEILDAVEQLSPDEQVDLIAVIRRRLAERGRQRIVGDVREGRAQFEQGLAAATSVDDLMREISP